VSAASVSRGVGDALRLVAALDGSLRGAGKNLLDRECRQLWEEISGDGARVQGLIEGGLTLAWFACREIAERDGCTERDVAERLGAKLEDLLDDS
jgi:hypothetical protein